MKLELLLRDVEVLECRADLSTDITGIAYDSRNVIPGNLFAAITGFSVDGHRFIASAMELGASAILCERIPDNCPDAPYVLVKNSRLALALISANFFGRPAEKMTFIGVTGTNGKTTCTYLLKHLLETTCGAKVGLIGTIQNMIGSKAIDTERTTPESYELQALFAEMVDAGCTHVVMEVSSHSLVLDRVAGIHYKAALFTNLTQDHLDFHGTMEEYRKAKAILFKRCEKGILNADDEASAAIAKDADCEITTYGQTTSCTLGAEAVQLQSNCVEFDAKSAGDSTHIRLGIPGGFTVYNALGVLETAIALGISPKAAAASLATATGVKGRVEVVPTPGKPYTVLIDYAHTPDGLENVLSSVKGYCKGRLIAVFGCGGDRDNTKRPIMGRIGADIADIAVITSDNPRTEDPMTIINMILDGIDDRSNCIVMENRPKAIALAMDLAQKDDIIVLCGKGHETYQILGKTKHHLDEREVVAAYLNNSREVTA